MTRRTRRRFGATLLTLLAVQSVAAPLGACAQEHEGHGDPGPTMAMGQTTGHAHEVATAAEAETGHEEHRHDTPDSSPADCLALTACGAPAMGATIASAGIATTGHVVRKVHGILDEPAAIVLTLTTPPPKI